MSGAPWDTLRRCGGADAAEILALAPWAGARQWPGMRLVPLRGAALAAPPDAEARLAEKRRLFEAGAPVFGVEANHDLALAEAAAMLSEDISGSPPPFLDAALGVVDDVCVLAPPDGQAKRYRLIAGLVCTPSYWCLPSRLGLPIDAIHAPVPSLNAVLGRRIDDFFLRLPAGRRFARTNWFVHGSPLLAQFEGEDREPLDAPERLWLRSEWQTLRRLPRSGAILFTIRALTAPATVLASEPDLGRALIAAARALPEPVQRARRVAEYLPVLRALVALVRGEGG